MKTPLSEKLTDIITPLAASLGLELWGLEVAVGGRSLVRVFVEGPEGADVEQCAKLSRLIALSLDVEDPIAGPYLLEVSSPGLERVFFTSAQLAAFTGRTVDVTLFQSPVAHPNRRRFLGELTGVDGESFRLRPLEPTPGQEESELVFTWDEVRKAKLIHFLPEPEGAVKGRKPGAKSDGSKKPKKPKGAGADDACQPEEL